MAEQRIFDEDRLAALARTSLLDSAPEESFDRITSTLARILGVPVSVVSLVDDHRQFFKSNYGLPKPWSETRETPHSHSFCKYVIDCDQPLVVCDAREDSQLKDNPAIPELGVVAYLGHPITVDNRFTIGSLAAIDDKPREWTEFDRATVRDFAAILSNEIELRTQIVGEGGYVQELRESSEQLERILNSTGEGIYGIDKDGRCTFSNQSCAILLGYDSPDHLLGKSMHDLIHHTRPDGSLYRADECRIHVAAIQGNPVHVEDEVLWKKDGSSFPAEYRSYPIEKNGRLLGAVVTFSDITDRLKNQREMISAREQAEEADRQKTQFLANMSHEIRTPMNAILGFSELMAGVVVSKKAKDYLSVIRESGKSLLELINDILDLSKVEAGRIELNIEAVDFCELVQSVVALIAPSASDKELALAVNTDANLPKYLLLDRLRIRQILLNLLANAVKFTSEGGISIQVSGVEDSDDDRRMDLTLSVTDTGKGISEKQQEKIFEPFHQVAMTDGSEHSGTGLGLGISQKLARLMNGEISVRSAVGEGSTFTLILHHVDIATDDAVISSTRVDTEDDLNLIEASRILVADDNAVNRHLISEMFADTHHEILLAEDGAQAVEIAKREAPDLVLMDIRMPKIDGRKALKMLRSEADLTDLPVVAVTASSLLNKEKALRKAFDGYLRKPFSRAQLFRELARRLPVREREHTPGSDDSTEPKAAEQKTLELLIPDGRRDDWIRLVVELTELEASSWQSVSETLAIQTVIEFARNLKRLGVNADCKPLGEYAEQLQAKAESFQLSRLERQLSQFPDLLAQLNNSIESAA